MFENGRDLTVAIERTLQPAVPAGDFGGALGTKKKRKGTVTARDIRRFAQAIGETLPEPSDDDDSGLLAPPLFCQTLSYDELPVELLPADGSPAELDVPVPATRLVGGASDFRLHRRVRAGEQLSVETELEDVQMKSGKSGTLYLLVIETRVSDARGNPVSTETATYVKRS